MPEFLSFVNALVLHVMTGRGIKSLTGKEEKERV
jgi:hypothetical protein